MNRDDIFLPRTDTERAADNLHRSRPPRPKTPPQTEALFEKPQRQERRLVPVDAPEPTELFPELEPSDRQLVPIQGWPDYAARDRRGTRGGAS